MIELATIFLSPKFKETKEIRRGSISTPIKNLVLPNKSKFNKKEQRRDKVFQGNNRVRPISERRVEETSKLTKIVVRKRLENWYGKEINQDLHEL